MVFNRSRKCNGISSKLTWKNQNISNIHDYKVSQNMKKIQSEKIKYNN